MESLKHSIIGEFWDKGFVEALLPGKTASLRICVRVPSQTDYPLCLNKADTLLPGLIADIDAVEVKAAQSVESDAPSSVFGIWIEPDGSASYTCGFFDGKMEGELVEVERSQEGVLSIIV